MATLTKHLLSESISGKHVVIAGLSAEEATPIHVAPATTGSDEIWIYATNTHTDDVVVTLMWGLSALGPSAGDAMVVTIPYQSGRALLYDGRLLQNGLSAVAHATTGGVINVDGFVNRITP